MIRNFLIRGSLLALIITLSYNSIFAETYVMNVTPLNMVSISTGSSIVVSSNSPVCKGSTINLSVTEVAGATYSWTGPDGFTSTDREPSLMALASSSGSYNVTVTDGTGSVSGSTSVVVSPTLTGLTITSNSPVCEGENINFGMDMGGVPYTNASSYTWTGPNGFTASVHNPSVNSVTSLAGGTYSVIVSNGGCIKNVSTSVSIKAKPSSLAAGSNGPICDGGSLHLTASTITNATYSWTGPGGYTSTDQNPVQPIVSISWAGNYSVRATVDGCQSDAATVDVVIHAIPSPPTSGSNSPVCIGADINLTGSTVAGGSYSWTGPDGFISTDQNPVISNAVHPDNAGNYIVKVTVNGCQSGGSLTNVLLTSIPDIRVSNDGPYCKGETITFNTIKIDGATYSWTGPDGFTSSDRNPVISNAVAANTGIYQVNVDLSTCSKQGTSSVVVNDPVKPIITFISAQTKLSSSTASGNQWYKDGALMNGENNQDLLLTSAGNYTVKVTGGNGCSSESDSYNYNPTSLMSESQIVLSLYPNPASTHLQLSGEYLGTGFIKIRISSMLGESRIAYQLESFGTLNELIDISMLAEGIYLMELETSYGVQSYKVVVKK